MPKEKITSFTKLDAWKEGHVLVLLVYKATKQFPKDELFGLTNQMRRCVVSISSNIAEGFSRQSWKEKIQFYAMSAGSLTELQNQLMIARDVSYMSHETFHEIADQSIRVSKLLHGLIKSAKRFT